MKRWHCGGDTGDSVLRDILRDTDISKVEIVDLHTDYSLDDHRDGIHPNESGAKKIAERLLPVVSAFMN